MARKKKVTPLNGMRLMRLARKMTQEELAMRVGCHNQTISRIELGYNNATMTFLQRIADALQCDIRNLY